MPTSASSKLKWEEFFMGPYCDEELYQLSVNYPDQKHLNVDIKKLHLFDIDLSEELIQCPVEVLSHADEAINDVINLTQDVPEKDCYVRLCNMPDYMKIFLKDIRSEELSKLVFLSGAVRRVGEPVVKFINAAFECQRCGYISMIQQSGRKMTKPLECENEQCGRQGPFKLLIDQSITHDGQIMYIQEHSDNIAGGEQPRVLPIYLDNEVVGQFQPGNKVNCIGIVYAEIAMSNKVQLNEMEYYVIGQNITVVDDENDLIIISPEERIEFEYLSQHPDIIKFLIDSFAPYIIGEDYIKLALMSSIVSGPSITTASGKTERRYSHTLICGDPGTAKSQLLEYSCSLIPRAQFTTGEGSTTVGLTAAVVKDELLGKGWAVDAGALVLADKALAVIDEMDALDEIEIKGLNTALSKSFVEIHKAGINTQLPCREPVLAGLNPVQGRFDRYEEIPGQINIKPDTLSRFDFIFTLFDVPEPIRDNDLADAILYEGEHNTSLNFQELQKYLHLARSIHDTELSEDALLIIKQYFLDLRSVFSEKEIVSITARHLEALKRITRSIANLHLQSVATANHAKLAVDLLNKSFESFTYDKSKGVFDVDICETGLSHSQRDKMKLFKDIIRDVQRDHEGTAPQGDLILALSKEGFSDTDIEKRIKKLMQVGKLFQPRNGYYKVT